MTTTYLTKVILQTIVIVDMTPINNPVTFHGVLLKQRKTQMAATFYEFATKLC